MGQWIVHVRAPLADAVDTATHPSYHIVESWDIEKMMEEPPTDY